MYTARLTLFGAATLLAACGDATGPNASPMLDPLNSSAASRDSDHDSHGQLKGGVFTQTNDASGNAVVAYARRADGSLSYLGTYSTGGLGTAPASGLGSQGAVLLTPNNRVLLATNAGSDEISSFTVGKNGLALVTTISSAGTRPVSVAATNHLAYVLNNGSSSVAGFRIGRDGVLAPVPTWTRSLSRSGANAAQVQFTRDGRFLVVVHRAAPGFDVFPVKPDGSLGSAVFSRSAGTAPFGFDITARGQVVVSEPGPNTPGTEQSASSYELRPDGSLHAVSSGIPSLQAAPCWVVITKNGRFAYTANAGSGSISGYAIAADGSLRLITDDGRTGITGAGSTPLDMDVSRDNRFLYVIEGGTGNVMGFAIGRDGSLAPMADVAPPLPVRGRGGLAAF
jgi:6-phosphogluconolactonase (cycloisomerase 2 family)